MDCMQYPLTETLPFNQNELHYSPKFTHKFTFNAELCGIWLGDLPFNQHLEATLLPAHMMRTPLGTPHIPACTPRPHRNDSTKTELPQRSSKKNSTSFGFNCKLVSADSDSFDFSDEIARRLESTGRLQMEACRISGSIAFAKGCLVFRSRDSDLKIPTHLGGPGDQELLSPNVQHSLDYGFSLNCDHLNSGTVFDLSYWTIENDTNFSYQSLLSSQSGCFSGGRKIWSNVNNTANLRKRGLKQFWTNLLSKKSKQNRQSMDIDAPSFQTLVPPEQTPSSPRETLRLEWPLTTLRQFAFNGYLFKMETGRRAPHGEGHYLFRIPDIVEFRQNLEAHIDHLKRSRRMKTRSAVCYRSSPPSVPPPPPPPSSLTRPYVNISTILHTPPLNRSWTNLLQPIGKAEEGFNELENADNDWLVELALPPPPPPTSAPILMQNTIPIRNEQSQMPRVGTYENVRNVLSSQDNGSKCPQLPIVVPSSTNLERSPKTDSTINYAMLDFQEPSIHRGNSRNQSIGSPPRRSYRRPVISRTKSSSCERLTRLSVSQIIRRLAISVEGRLNMTELENREKLSSKTGSSNGGNYVDICPLQTLAINELLRNTL